MGSDVPEQLREVRMQLNYDDDLNEWLSPPPKHQFEMVLPSSMRKKKSKETRANFELDCIELFPVDIQQKEIPSVCSQENLDLSNQYKTCCG
jgi:acetaldehyde dehydrogenase (acetylating)